MNNIIKIICTLGPSSLNKRFLNFAKRNGVKLLRLNMSHLKIVDLKKSIDFIKKKFFNSNLYWYWGSSDKNKSKSREIYQFRENFGDQW